MGKRTGIHWLLHIFVRKIQRQKNPWISAAFMEPMMRMDDLFGSFDRYDPCERYSVEELKEMMSEYHIGAGNRWQGETSDLSECRIV